MRLRTILLTSAILMAVASLHAAPRTTAQMRQAAAEVLSRTGKMARVKGAQTPLREMKRTEDYSVWGLDNGGFAIIAVDDAMPEILGYSERAFNPSTDNPNFNWWLRMVSQASEQARSQGKKAPGFIVPDTAKFKQKVPTLMTSEWGQDRPYWNACPVTTDTCVTGCVATAMAQLIYYQRAPEHGTGSHTHSMAGTADFENTYYRYDKMRDLYYCENYTAEEAEAVAELMSHCGIAVDMDYSPEGSGAMSSAAADALRDYFGYADVKFIYRNSYNERQWMEILYEELCNNRPVYYSGVDYDPNDGGGHAFVLDGYDENGYVSVNWGWNGTENGYYNIALLDPRTYSFNGQQDMIIGIGGNPLESVSREVKVSSPGTLSQLISGSDVTLVTQLKVEGALNGSDLALLRQMAGRNADGTGSRGRLAVLDLSEATIVAGGTAYLSQEGHSYYTKDNELGDYAFHGCRMLRHLVIPKGIVRIGKSAFGFCDKLETLEGFEQNERSNFIFDGEALYSSNDTTCLLMVMPSVKGSYTVKNGVTLIDDGAFSSCQHIKELYLPSSLQRIGNQGLFCAWKLQIIKLLSREPIEVGADGLYGIRKSMCKLYVPAGSKNAYKRHGAWGEFVREGSDGYDNIVEFGSAITARNAGKFYGDEMPRLGYSISGDMVTGIPEVWCDADQYSPAGSYVIHVGPGTVTDEIVEYFDGTLTIWQAPLKVKVDNYTRFEGEENPEFEITISGYKLGEDASVLTQVPEASCEATPSSPVGEYPIVISGGKADNYEFRYTHGVLTVLPDPTGITNFHGNALENAGITDIYTLDGRKVLSSDNTLKGLPSGIYVIKGKKLIVK